MAQRQSELELAVTETVLAQPTKIRRNAKKKIRIRVWKTYRIVPWVLFTLLTSISIYTLFTMNYGEVVLLDATRQFFTDLQRIFLQPRLSGRFPFEALLQALGMTIGLAVITTLLGGVTAFLMALFTARNISQSGISNAIRTVMSFIRAVPTILWVMIFSILIGLGANAAIIGMSFHTIAYLTKVFSESIEEIDSGVIEALRACGASWWQVVFQAILPSCMTSLLSWLFIRFEINFTNAIAVGAAAGAGGLGFQLAMTSSFYFDFHEIGVLVYMILAVVAILEVVAIRLRKKYIIHA
ncbi:phosphonate ABC transporter, permease PhnE [Enterococcus sp. DIV1368b]|uniref:PhnE/PtxC family ABC transporter permease n=1 Tax=Enterococcus sp. DIV1368b TaxID=2774711 RepID=UPI003D300170